MKKNFSFAIKKLSFFIAACIICSCNHTVQTVSNDTYSYTDDYGQTTSVPTHPKRIVSLSPAVTEIIFALGADSLLVGRTEFCLFPPQASAIENIGGISNLNVEKVLSMQPDLIISGSMVPQKVVQQFEKMGVPMACVIEKTHFDGLYENISKIGQLTGRQTQADSLNTVLRLRMQQCDIDKSVLSSRRPSVYYVVGFGSGGNFTAGGNTFINDIITMAGGQNIAADSEGWSFSLESLMDADPDYILIRAEDSATFANASPYNRLSAVRNNRIIALQSGMIDLQVPRNIDVIELLNSIFTKRD